MNTALTKAGSILCIVHGLSSNDQAWLICSCLIAVAAKTKCAVTSFQTAAELCSMKFALSSSACAGSRRLGAVRNGAISYHCCIGLASRCCPRQPPHCPPPLPTYLQLQPATAHRGNVSTAPAHGRCSDCQAAVLHDHSHGSSFWCWQWHQQCP